MAIGHELESRLQEVESRIKELNKILGVGSFVADEEAHPEYFRLASPGAREVHVIELDAAAGSGSDELGERVVGRVWFRRDWLDGHGLDPTQCRVIGVRGESMEPTLPDGCSILVDLSSRRRYDGRVYVIRMADGVVVKRLKHGELGGSWLIVSDHPAWEDRPWPEGTQVIGRVHWMAGEL